MTEDEHIDLAEAGNKFWHEFSALCNKYINAAPKHLQREYEEHLGEKTSMYGRDENA